MKNLTYKQMKKRLIIMLVGAVLLVALTIFLTVHYGMAQWLYTNAFDSKVPTTEQAHAYLTVHTGWVMDDNTIAGIIKYRSAFLITMILGIIGSGVLIYFLVIKYKAFKHSDEYSKHFAQNKK